MKSSSSPLRWGVQYLLTDGGTAQAPALWCSRDGGAPPGLEPGTPDHRAGALSSSLGRTAGRGPLVDSVTVKLLGS